MSTKSDVYVNPILSNHDYGLVRVGGPGLANCLFIASRAALIAKKYDGTLLRPTWERIGLGQWVRKEKDKRFYSGLFQGNHMVEGVRKLWIMATRRHVSENAKDIPSGSVIIVKGLGNYFDDFKSDVKYVRSFVAKSISADAISSVPLEMRNSIAVHVRLGDYVAERRVPIKWYKDVLNRIIAINAGRGRYLDIQLFSDGTDEELGELLAIKGVRRVFYGNALADIIAISRCSFLVGSDSTFSGWGAFLGNVHSVFAKLHYGRPLPNPADMIVAANAADIPTNHLRISFY